MSLTRLVYTGRRPGPEPGTLIDAWVSTEGADSVRTSETIVEEPVIGMVYDCTRRGAARSLGMHHDLSAIRQWRALDARYGAGRPASAPRLPGEALDVADLLLRALSGLDLEEGEPRRDAAVRLSRNDLAARSLDRLHAYFWSLPTAEERALTALAIVDTLSTRR